MYDKIHYKLKKKKKKKKKKSYRVNLGPEETQDLKMVTVYESCNCISEAEWHFAHSGG